MITVVAALIKKDNKYLIAKRYTGSEDLTGKWEFPGGKVEKNEDEMKAIEREIEEEFELKIKAKRFLTNNIYKYPDKEVNLKLYECDYINGKFHLHDHSEYKFVNKDEILNYDLCPADIKLANYIKEYYQDDLSNFDAIDNLIIGNIYSNKDIANNFKCSLMGGMRRSKTTNSLVLIAKHDNPLYDDEWTEDGILNYTGMGTIGDQSIDFGQNKTLKNAKKQGIKVYLFESYKENEYYFCGEVELCGKIYSAYELDSEGNNRKVIKFPLKKKDNKIKVLVDKEDLENSEKIKEKKAQKLSKEELKGKLKNVNPKVTSKEVKTIYRERNPLVAEYTKKRSKGICDLCGKEAPFKDKNGNPYLESHHVITLSEGGPDAIYNTVSICPNCHRKIHVLKRKEDIKKLEQIILKYLLEDEDTENIKKYEELFEHNN